MVNGVSKPGSLRWDRYHIIPPMGRKNYIYCQLGDYISPIPPFKGEPETTIDIGIKVEPLKRSKCPSSWQAPAEPIDVVSFEEAYPQYVSWCCQNASSTWEVVGGFKLSGFIAVFLVRYGANWNFLNNFGVQTVGQLHEEVLSRVQRIISALQIAPIYESMNSFLHHQKFQVPKMEVRTLFTAMFSRIHKPYISYVYTAYIGTYISTSILGTWNVWWMHHHWFILDRSGVAKHLVIGVSRDTTWAMKRKFLARGWSPIMYLYRLSDRPGSIETPEV